MILRRTLIAAASAAALALTAAPALADGSPPVKGGVKCTMKVKGSLALGKVLRRGLPVKVTCDGPAKFLAMPDFAAMSKASIEYATSMAPAGRRRRASSTAS